MSALRLASPSPVPPKMSNRGIACQGGPTVDLMVTVDVEPAGEAVTVLRLLW